MKLLCVATGDAGRMLQINRSTVWRRVQHGRLQGIAAGNRTLIPLYEVADQMEITLSEAMRITEQRGIVTHISWIERVAGTQAAKNGDRLSS